MSLSAPFRAALPSDHAIVLEMIREYYVLDGIPFDKEAIGTGLEMLLAKPELGRVFLICKGSELAGYLIVTFGFDLEFGGRFGTVTDIYLRPPYRGQGLGTASMSALFGLGREWGVKVFHLQPERKNSAAVSFYRKLGFSAQDRLVMNKWLDLA